MQDNSKKNTILSERISEIIEIEKITANEFAKQLGYNRSQTVYDIVNGKSKPSAEFFQRFIDAGYSARYSIEWVIAGKGYKEKALPPQELYSKSYLVNEDNPKYGKCHQCEEKERLIQQLQKENEKLWKLIEGNKSSRNAV